MPDKDKSNDSGSDLDGGGINRKAHSADPVLTAEGVAGETIFEERRHFSNSEAVRQVTPGHTYDA